jgi:peptidoglycan/LPS O-acetylase OafA/YrhL
LAIALVVLHHSIQMGLLYPSGVGYPPTEGLARWVLTALSGLGVFAVPIFLFISGSFVAWAARGDPPRFSWSAVWAALNRLIWPYVIWSLVFYGVVYVIRGEELSILGVFRKLAIGYPYHFVPLLAFYYLLSPVLVRVARRWGLVTLLVVALVQLILLNLVFPGVLGFEFPGWVRAVVPEYYNSVFADWGIYFPLGVVCSLNAKAVVAWVRKLKWPLLGATLIFYALYILSLNSVVNFPQGGLISPLLFVPLTLVIKRKAIPQVRALERFGKRSYGIYLMHLSVLWVAVVALEAVVPVLFGYQILLQPVLFVASLGGPLAIMGVAASLPTRKAYRYVFG